MLTSQLSHLEKWKLHVVTYLQKILWLLSLDTTVYWNSQLSWWFQRLEELITVYFIRLLYVYQKQWQLNDVKAANRKEKCWTLCGNIISVKCIFKHNWVYILLRKGNGSLCMFDYNGYVRGRTLDFIYFFYIFVTLIS